MTQLNLQHERPAPPTPEPGSTTIARESVLVTVLAGVLFVGALAVSAAMLGAELAVIGTFVAFPMMLLIGMPLILACVGDDLAEHGYGGQV